MQTRGRKGNRYEIREDHAAIFDCRGHEILVDIDDLLRVLQFTWRTNRDPSSSHSLRYARTHIRQEDGKFKSFTMHRLLINAPAGVFVDHINGNPLDNRRSNLRLASPKDNARNGRINGNNTSGYKGVHWNKKKQRWIARITVDCKRIVVGWYGTREEAALAYNDAATMHFGDFANLNDLSGYDCEELRRRSQQIVVFRTNTSGYRGVSREGNRWRARGHIGEQEIVIGYFGTREEAAEAYNRWAIERYGDKARLNVIQR